MDGSRELPLTLRLDDQSLEILENLAATQRCSVDEYVMGLVRRALRSEQKLRKPKTLDSQDAPLDAFLPEGTDPFAPVSHGDNGLASSFADVQTRMRFAGTPSILRDMDP
jgi:hypothetical protein